MILKVSNQFERLKEFNLEKHENGKGTVVFYHNLTINGTLNLDFQLM